MFVFSGLRHSLVAQLGIACLIGGGCTAANAQTLEFQMRQGQAPPWQSTVYPETQKISVHAAGDWTARVTGFLATGCNPWKSECFQLSPKSGRGPSEVQIVFPNLGSESLGPGVYIGAIEIGTQHWNVKLTILKRHAYLPFVYRPGYPKNCVNTIPQLPLADTCVITEEEPPNNFTGLPKAGSTFTDPQFGSPVHRLTGPGQNVSYASMRAFSASGKYILTVSVDGFLQVWNRESGNPLGAPFGGINVAQAVWDPHIDEKLWFYDAAKVGYRNIVTGKVTILADYRDARGNRPAFEKLDSGGTGDNTDDNWWVFTEEKTKQVCAIDLNDLNRANQEDHLHCANYSLIGANEVDFPQVTQVDSESKKRYVLLLSTPNAHVFSVDPNARNLNYEYRMPADITTPHSDVSQDSMGRQVLVWGWYDRFGDKTYFATAYLNRGPERLLRPVEEPGGGLTLMYPIYSAAVADQHFGCSWSGYCVMSSYQAVAMETKGIPSLPIAGIKPGSPCTIELPVNHSFKNGMSVVIGGAGEMNGANGVSRIQVLDSKTFALEGRACSGEYRNKTGHVAESKQWEANAPNRDEIVVARLDSDLRRVAIHRVKSYADQGDLSRYWSSPRASISRDGRFVAWASNLGLPEKPSVFWAEVFAP